MRDGSNVDIDAELIPIQAGAAGAELLNPVFIRTTGAISDIAGLLGPSLTVSTATNSISVTAAANDLAFAMASTVATNIFNATTSFQQGGVKVVGAQGAAVADAASPDATDLATAITLVNELKAQLNTLLARLRASTGHGLIA